MTTDEARKFQFEMLELIRRYHANGAAYDDLTKCVLNVASSVAITADIRIAEGLKLFEVLYKLAEDDCGPPPLKN